MARSKVLSVASNVPCVNCCDTFVRTPCPMAEPAAKISPNSARLFLNAVEPTFATLLEIVDRSDRSEEHTSELQSLMRISYAVFCLKNKKTLFTTKYTKSLKLTN